MLAEITQCSNRPQANWPEAAIMLIVAIAAVIIFAVWRFTDNERLKIKLADELAYAKKIDIDFSKGPESQ
jgi:hypothetical protein